jgi:hypothetical protein
LTGQRKRVFFSASLSDCRAGKNERSTVNEKEVRKKLAELQKALENITGQITALLKLVSTKEK